MDGLESRGTIPAELDGFCGAKSRVLVVMAIELVLTLIGKSMNRGSKGTIGPEQYPAPL